MWISPKVRVLLKTDNPTSDGPLSWISPYSKFRMVVIQPGCPESHRSTGYQVLVRIGDSLVGGAAWLIDREYLQSEILNERGRKFQTQIQSLRREPGVNRPSPSGPTAATKPLFGSINRGS